MGMPCGVGDDLRFLVAETRPFRQQEHRPPGNPLETASHFREEMPDCLPFAGKCSPLKDAFSLHFTVKGLAPGLLK
jgi:hypothetical protein